MKISRILAFTILAFHPLFVYAGEPEICVEIEALVPSVADFDANGIVNRKDIAMLRKVIRKNKRIERRNRRIEKYNSRRSRQHRGEEKSNSRRLKELQQIVYAPMFDRNADGEIDYIDMFKATLTMGKESTPADQELVTINKEILAGTYSCVEPTATIVEPTVTIPSTDTVPVDDTYQPPR